MTSYDEIAQEFHNFMTLDPIACTWSGVEGKDHLLPDVSQEKINSTIKIAENLISKVETFDRTPLSFDQNLDLDLVVLALKHSIFLFSYTFNGKTQSQQMPLAGSSVGNAINPLFVRDERDAETRLSLILSRLTSVRRYLRQILENLDTPVKRWVDMDLSACAGFPFLLDNIYKWAESIEYSKLEELKKAKWDAEDAMNDYMDKLEDLPTTSNFSMGDERAREWVKLRGVDLSLEEIHKIGKIFLSENEKLIDSLRIKLLPKYNLPDNATNEDLTNAIQQKYRLTIQEIIPRYKTEQAKINHFIEETGLFESPSNSKLIIASTPRYLIPLIPIGAVYPPKGFGSGVKKSIIYLTVTEDRLDDQNAIAIKNTMIHEGKPGHHLHYANAYENSSIIRKHIDEMRKDLTEGWATYLEDYMIEAGFVRDEIVDELKFVSKRELARMGARVLIDLYFMSGDEKYLDSGLDIEFPEGGDMFQKAAALLTRVTAFSQARAQAELNWYSQRRGYPLSYLTGNFLVKQLKRDMKSHLGAKFEGLELDKKFHSTFLNAGFMPVAFMRKVFENENLIEKA